MYVGTAYHGWQVQKNAVTVAETLEHSLASVVGHPVKCTGAGRTDAGVHAETYIANFRPSSRIPCDRIPLAVNTRLPDDIVVVKATEVPDGFNAIGGLAIAMAGVYAAAALAREKVRQSMKQSMTPEAVWLSLVWMASSS